MDIANRAVGNIVGIVSGLQGLGAQHILVPGMPDLGLTPNGRQTGASEASALSAYFNMHLMDALPTGATFYDTSALLHRVVEAPALLWGRSLVRGEAGYDVRTIGARP